MRPSHWLTFADVSRENRRSWPQRTAVVDGDTRLDYVQIDARTNRLAQVLLAEGIAPGDRLIWIGQNSFRVLETLIAAAKVGAVLCVANWRQTESELRWLLDDWNPRIAFWESAVPDGDEAIAPLREGSPALWIEGTDGYEARLDAAEDIDPDLSIDPASGLIALYTSAFDGKPNAAVLSHDAVISHDMVIALLRRVEPGAFSYLACGPLFHVGTMMWLTTTFHLAGTNVVMAKFDASEACRLIEAEKIQYMLTVPAMLDDLATANAELQRDLTSLEVIPLSTALAPMITADESPFGRALGGYGQTEVAGFATFAGLGGRTSPLLHVRIIDDEGVEVAPGEVGEIVARGRHTMNGYHGREELTAQRLRDGWHHTEDLGRREADGSITFIGPKRRMIKSGSENIYVAEVEQALLTHADIQEVAIIGAPDPKWDQRVKAIVVRREGATIAEADVIAHCRSQIASYKKPREVVFVASLPRKGWAIDYEALDAAHGGGGYPGAR